MSIEIVRGELERLFSLEELFSLSGDLLNFTPAEVGGTASKASFAKALLERSVETHAVPALLDAIVASRIDVDPRVKELAKSGASVDAELKAGESFGPFQILRKVADGPRATIYVARKDEEERLLKVFRAGASSDAAAARRFVAQSRLLSKVTNESLPSDLEVGSVGTRLWAAYKLFDGQPLAARVARSGALHLNEAKPILRGILGALAGIHGARLAHGGVKLENVLVTRGANGAPLAVLVDAASDKLGLGLSALAKPWAGRAVSP